MFVTWGLAGIETDIKFTLSIMFRSFFLPRFGDSSTNTPAIPEIET